MHSHPSARLTPLSLKRLLRQHIDHEEHLTELAAQAGISLGSAYKWHARYRSGGAKAWRTDATFAVPSRGHSVCTNFSTQ